MVESKTPQFEAERNLCEDLWMEDRAASYIGLKKSTLRDRRCRRNRDQPDYIKLGKRIYYRKSDLDAYIERCRQQAPQFH